MPDPTALPQSGALALLTATLLVCHGCASISPPGPMLPHDGPAPLPKGSTEVGLMLNAAGGIFLDGGVGVVLRVVHQLTPTTAAGGDFGVGFHSSPKHARELGRMRRMWMVRAHGQHNPGGLENLALVGGSGLTWTSRDLLALTLDTSVLTGNDFSLSEESNPPLLITPLAALTTAVSIPLAQGQPFQNYEKVFTPQQGKKVTQPLPTTTWYIGGTVGIGVEGTKGLAPGGTLTASWFWADAEFGEAILMNVALTPRLRLHTDGP